MALSYGFCLGDSSTAYTSEEFSEAMRAVFGDGVCPYGARFNINSISNFTVTVGTGFALCAGRWVENDEPLTLTFYPAGNYADRYDAIAVQVDYAARTATLRILTGIDPAAPPRDGEVYTLYLYTVRVKRGGTMLSEADFTDTRGLDGLCGYLTPLSSIAGDVEYIYQFLQSGIDREVARIIGLSDQVVQDAQDAMAELEGQIAAVRGVALGDTLLSLSRPAPANEYLLCDGSAVPSGYAALIDVIGETLPLLTSGDDRYQYWIYAGTPAT